MQTELDGIADTPSEFVRHIILDDVINLKKRKRTARLSHVFRRVANDSIVDGKMVRF